MQINILSKDEFDFLAAEKGKLAHIVNECCEESHDGAWLVIEETLARILIEVRYMDRLERDYLCNRVFSYCDAQPRSGQRVRRIGEKNDIVRIEVKWTVEGLNE